MSSRPTTLRELKDSGYKTRSVKLEMRENLMTRLREKEPLFPEIVGYEDSVIPEIANAVLAQHNFILLGLRGQAKTRILRSLTTLLDEEIPVIAGSEVNDDPLRPLSAYARHLLAEHGEQTPIRWVGREARFVEKLATPDTTIADLIGDLDPIKAAHGGHVLSDELVIHFGLLPRANRGVFCINELPDLASKVQVGLFNIMQEGDVQIKGFPVRMPLDVLLVFSANPEDYTARGKIITPLKDRMGSEIRTHYPRTIEEGMTITRQEAWVNARVSSSFEIVVPPVIWQVIEHIAFAARQERRLDQRSGVSQRLPISVMETVVSNAERRALVLGEKVASPRIADIYAATPAMIGKLELEYEGEQIGAERIILDIIRRSCGLVYEHFYTGQSQEPVLEEFASGRTLALPELASDKELLAAFMSMPPIVDFAKRGGFDPDMDQSLIAKCELVLEGLSAQKRLARKESSGRTSWSTRTGEAPRSRDMDESLN